MRASVLLRLCFFVGCVGLPRFAAAQDAAPPDRNAINSRARPGNMLADSPVTFPKEGALPAKYPPDVREQSEPVEKEYYILSSPCRSLAQIAEIRAAMPKGEFTCPAADWTHLERTRRILTQGGELRLLALGDSIVNDTMRSGWVAKLAEAYPKTKIQATVYVRGGGGCQHFKELDRIATHVIPRKPDLVFIGGISQRDIESIREVIHQLRAGLPELEILLATGAFGTVDPRDPEAMAKAPHSGTGAYGQALNKLAAEEKCAYLDMTTPWAEYIRSAKVHPHLFYRDVVHANEFGEQILSKTLMAFWTAPERDRKKPFTRRGYYLTFMRMPVMGLPEWKQAIDCFAEDEANVIVLWTAGGFRSRKFPVTWGHNQDHANVRKDFGRELIDYAHRKNIRVLLGFTPFGYDGVNRLPLEHPELKARKQDGSVVDPFGIHCWGWNLCPAKPESQRLMREYIGEMVFEFYPNADGLLVESSDYGFCQCPDCGPRYYEHEFTFVRWLSEEVWRRNPEALVLVYPHYFTGKKVPGLEAVGSRQPFDSRWGLFFTAHSAHFDAELIAKASASVFWSDAPVLGTPHRVAEAARSAREHGVTGFLPSLEAYSYVVHGKDLGAARGEGKQMQPFGLDPAGEGRMPYRSLLPRVQRFACRQFSQDPELDFSTFQQALGRHIFGAASHPEKVADLLELQRIWTYESDWCWSSPLLDPEFFGRRARLQNWAPEKLAAYDRNLNWLKDLAARYSNASEPAELEMCRLARTVVERWGSGRPGKTVSR